SYGDWSSDVCSSDLITAYLEIDSSTDAKGRPTGAREICGTARTNQFGDVDWVVVARDRGEPGVDDEFIIRLTQSGVIVYTTEFEIGRASCRERVEMM